MPPTTSYDLLYDPNVPEDKVNCKQMSCCVLLMIALTIGMLIFLYFVVKR